MKNYLQELNLHFKQIPADVFIDASKLHHDELL